MAELAIIVMSILGICKVVPLRPACIVILVCEMIHIIYGILKWWCSDE